MLSILLFFIYSITTSQAELIKDSRCTRIYCSDGNQDSIEDFINDLSFQQTIAYSGNWKVDWGLSNQNLVYCYPTDSNGKIFNYVYPVNDSYCIQKFGGEWAKDTQGMTRCYSKKGNSGLAPRFPIDSSYCL